MTFSNAARSIVIPLVLAAATTLHAADKDKYVLINKTKHAAYVICGNWIDSSINLSPGQTRDFTSVKFHVIHLVTLDSDGNFLVKDYLAQNVPGYANGSRFAFDQGGTYEITDAGLKRIS